MDSLGDVVVTGTTSSGDMTSTTGAMDETLSGSEDGFVHEEMAELLLAKGKPEEAKAHFVKAWALLEDIAWLKESEPKRYERLRQMAGN